MEDYFNEKGIWLGSDGKNDNKVFAAQNVSKSKSGLVNKWNYGSYTTLCLGKTT